ncbi:MAG: HAD family hydrolase [Janthinobacterium lividum]
MKTYKAVIFDLGNVVFDLSFDRIFQFWANASGGRYDEIKDKFRFDDVFDKFEKDEVTPAAFRSEISKRLGLKLTEQEFDEGWCDLYLAAYPGIDSLLANLKQRFRLVALTNTNSIHSNVWKIKYADTLRHFQKIFSSHELNERKPDAKAYQIVLDYLQAKPQQVVFLDDNIDNVKAADQLGIKAVLVTSFEQMTAELQMIGLLN